MKGRILLKALAKFVFGFLLVMILVFLPAGSFDYWNGWVFIGILFIPMFVIGIVLIIKNPELLEKRLNAKESSSEQKEVIFLSGIMFVAGFVTAGLNYRFRWLIMPDWTVILFSVIFLLSYLMYAEVLRENTYLSRTVEIQNNQRVIDTGLYGIVRHPMYSATILMFLSIPLMLGSFISFLIFLIYPFIIVKRIRNEETVLESGLEGYTDYKKKVKYRLVPFLW